jgi:hypothetical protein
VGVEVVKRFAVLSVYGVGLAAVPIGTAQTSAPSATAGSRTVRGTTSQRKHVRITIDQQHDLTGLYVAVTARCSDKRKRDFAITFPQFGIGPQDPAGNVSGSLDVFAGSFFSGGASSYREQASFSAHVSRRRVTGTVRATRTIDNGPTCKTGRISFRARL